MVKETYGGLAVQFFEKVLDELPKEEKVQNENEARKEFIRTYNTGIKRWDDKKTMSRPKGASTSEMLSVAVFVLESAKENKRLYDIKVGKYKEYASTLGHALGMFIGFFLQEVVDVEKFNKLMNDVSEQSEEERMHLLSREKTGLALYLPLVAEFAVKLKDMTSRKVETRLIGRAIILMMNQLKRKLDKDHKEFFEICAAMFDRC